MYSLGTSLRYPNITIIQTTAVSVDLTEFNIILREPLHVRYISVVKVSPDPHESSRP